MALIHADHISKHYTIDKREITVLKDITLSVEPDEFLAICGTSGSGKSTLLTLLSGLDTPSAGNIFFGEKNMTTASEGELATLRNQDVGFIFQSFHLVPSLTALENVIFPAQISGSKKAIERGERLLSRVGLMERANHLPSQLSGGEKQRIALLRALINFPKVIFADEPTGNLDSENGEKVFELLLELKEEYSATLILVTHNEAMSRTADRILHLKDGILEKNE